MFKKYSSIENHYNQKFISNFRDTVGDEDLVVTEKLHGTNFSIIVDHKGDVSFCKRSGIIKEDESFFGFRQISPELEKAAMQAFAFYEQQFSTNDSIRLDSLQIYGELVGPGIQKGVDYGDKNLYVFDMVGKFDIGAGGSEDTISKILDWDNMVALAHKSGFSTVPLISIIKFTDIDNLDVEGESSKVPGSNIDQIEGYVIKPKTVHFTYVGKRCIIKLKSKEHLEKKQVKKSQKKPVELSESDVNALDELRSYVTETRVVNVASKLGEFSPKDIPRIMGLTIKDVIEDYEKDGHEFSSIVEPKLIKKRLENDIRPLIIGHYMT